MRFAHRRHRACHLGCRRVVASHRVDGDGSRVCGLLGLGLLGLSR